MFRSSKHIYAQAIDDELGYPADGNRLVQRWAWFSLDWPAYDPVLAPKGFNGNLFDPFTSQVTGYGLHYASHTSGLGTLEHVDLSGDVQCGGWLVCDQNTWIAG